MYLKRIEILILRLLPMASMQNCRSPKTTTRALATRARWSFLRGPTSLISSCWNLSRTARTVKQWASRLMLWSHHVSALVAWCFFSPAFGFRQLQSLHTAVQSTLSVRLCSLTCTTPPCDVRRFAVLSFLLHGQDVTWWPKMYGCARTL